MKNSIRRRTFGYIAAGMLVIILAFAFLFYSYFYNVFRERMEEDQSRTVASAAERFGTVLTNIRQNAYYLCGNDTLASYLVNKEGISMVKQWDQIGITFSINTGAPNTPLMQSAHAMLLIDPQFPLSHFIQGGFAIKAGGWKRVYSALDVEEEDWYQKTLRLQGQIYAFHTPDDTTDVFFSQFLRSTRIADPRYNENMGVVLYAVPERRLMSILNGARMTDGAIGMVMFDDEPFLSTDTLNFPARGGSSAWKQMLISLPSDGAVKQIEWDGVSYLASSVTFQGDWKFLLLLPEADVYRYIKVPESMMATVGVLLLVISAIISLLLSKQLTRPIIKLSGAMAQARDGRYLPSPMPAPRSHDEIATLYSCYNSMTEHIQQLLGQTAEEAEKLRSAELKALQAQINPHFIYNTLDSVSCSALMEGNDDIVTMVTSLISILKYSVNFSRTTVPLREEIDYLQHYIRIQELRYKKGFHFECNVPEAYFDVPVSQIILQPLVENALFHAYCPDGELEICLFCEEKDGLLRIHVTDNGSGGDAEKLNSMLNCEGLDETDSHGIGIKNVNNRIRLLLGGQSGLHYDQLEGGGLDAVIQIPLKSQ